MFVRWLCTEGILETVYLFSQPEGEGQSEHEGWIALAGVVVQVNQTETKHVVQVNQTETKHVVHKLDRN